MSRSRCGFDDFGGAMFAMDTDGAMTAGVADTEFGTWLSGW